MKNDLYDTRPLDDLERELLNDNLEYSSIKNLENEKSKYQKIAQSSFEKRELLTEVMNDSEFEKFAQIISDNGLTIKETFHTFFQKVVNGTITTKQLSSS